MSEFTRLVSCRVESQLISFNYYHGLIILHHHRDQATLGISAVIGTIGSILTSRALD